MRMFRIFQFCNVECSSGVNEVVDRGPGDHCLFIAKPLACQQFVSNPSHSAQIHIAIFCNAPQISQKMLLP